MENVQAYVSFNDQLEYSMELFQPWDPRNRTNLCSYVIKGKITGPLQRGAFTHVDRKDYQKTRTYWEEYLYFQLNNQEHNSKNVKHNLSSKDVRIKKKIPLFTFRNQ